MPIKFYVWTLKFHVVFCNFYVSHNIPFFSFGHWNKDNKSCPWPLGTREASRGWQLAGSFGQPLLTLTQRMWKRKGRSWAQTSEKLPGVCAHCIGRNRSGGHPNHKEGWWLEDEAESSKKWEWVWMNTGDLCTHLQTHTQKCVHFQPWTRTQGFPLSLLRMKLEGGPCRRFSQGLQVGWPFPSQALGLPPASASGTCAFFDLSPSTSLPLWKLLQVSK